MDDNSTLNRDVVKLFRKFKLVIFIFLLFFILFYFIFTIDKNYGELEGLISSNHNNNK